MRLLLPLMGLILQSAFAGPTCRDLLKVPVPYTMPYLVRVGQVLFQHPNLLWCGKTKERVVALTFDDGPSTHPDLMPSVLEVLAQEGVPATFFVLGDRIDSSQANALLRQAHGEGHQIALHGYHHLHHGRFSKAEVAQSVFRTVERVEAALGARLAPRYFRPPWAGIRSDHLDHLQALGVRVTLATSVPGQAYLRWPSPHGWWPESAFEEPPARVLRRTLAEVRPGTILALHCGEERRKLKDRVWTMPHCATNARQVIHALRQRGYHFVTVQELDSWASSR